MHIALALISSLFAFSVCAQPLRPVVLPRDVEVRKDADSGLRPSLVLKQGERIWVGEDDGEFTSVRLKRANQWRKGFVYSEDLSELARGLASVDVESERYWAVGLMANASSTSQPGRHFQTTDMVNWTTSTYESHSVWPNLYVQFARRNFWRLAIGARLVDFKGSARVDVDANTSRAIEVKQTMHSLRIEKGFEIFGPIYLSLGAEVARASAMTETLAGVSIPTTSDDLAVSAGGALGLGAEFALGHLISTLIEVRYAYFPSVKPAAKSLDFTLGLAYWF